MTQDDPHLLQSGRAASLAGLLERIEAQFNAEVGGRGDLIAAEEARRETLRDITDYVLTVEGVRLSRAERLEVLELAYRDLFTFSALEPFLIDETITEVKITGHDRVYARRGAGDMQPVEARFDDESHLERLLRRVLAQNGIVWDSADPFVEAGLTIGERPARITATGAPYSPALHINLRLHPAQPPTLESLIAAGMLDEEAARWLRAIVEAGHGLMIAGESGSGKTSLLQALIPALPGPSVTVERARELRPPDHFRRLAATDPDAAGFAGQIQAGMEPPVNWLVLDEVRFDESAAMWEAITADHRPRLLWAFRGATEPIRLRTAFGMSVRRALPDIAQEFIHSGLKDRLPFVTLVARTQGAIRLLRIGEWQPDGDWLALRTLYPNPEASPLHPIVFK